MPPRREVRQKRRQRRIRRAAILSALVAVVAVVGVVLYFVVRLFVGWFAATIGGNMDKADDAGNANPSQTVGPKVVATATVGSSGDILIHNTVRKAAYNEQTQTYDFDYSLAHLAPYVSAVDYAVVNAEFSVSVDGNYGALPFRVPESVVSALKNCGYDMGLTANNHIADGGVSGIKKTMSTLAAYGMDYTGTRKDASDPKFLVKDINGIKIGFANFTYGSYWNTNGYDQKNPQALYNAASEMITQMRGEGADLIYFYIHWGYEYALAPDVDQTAVAQRLCDLGVDVIIGGHPHKIQPLELVTSTDGLRQMICLYSMGNLLSGQQVECMAGGTQANSPNCYQDSWHYPGCDYPDVADRTQDTHRLEHGTTCNDSGHTEDGLLFNVTASKFEDGTVMITGVDVLPVWCMGRGFIRAPYPTNSSFEEYIVIPLEKGKDWKTAYGLTDAEMVEAQYSYDRTMKLVGNGVNTINTAYQKKVDEYKKTVVQ